MKFQKIKIRFGEPSYGWLPVTFTSGEFILEMGASNVPVDPLYQLVIALRKAIKGLDSEVWWHLEPHGYYFIFEPKGSECLLRIEYEHVSLEGKKRSEKFSTVGNIKDIVLPLWRGLMEFQTYDYYERDWPQLPKGELKKLTKLIKT